MKIVVCVKYVPDAASARSFEADGTVDREAVSGLLSELDEYAVEQALRIKDEAPDTEVVAVCIGPAAAEDAVRRALQMGADSGIHVQDAAIAGSDALATSLVLAKAVEKAGFDLILCGMASTDGGIGVVPAMLSERLGIPGLMLAANLQVEGPLVRIRRDTDAATEVVEATLPLIVAVTDQTGEARYPSFKGIMAAKKKDVQTWSLADLGIDPAQVGLAASWSAVDSTAARPARQAGTVVIDADGAGAPALVDFLVAGKFV